jgi:hypothetical protein
MTTSTGNTGSPPEWPEFDTEDFSVKARKARSTRPRKAESGKATAESQAAATAAKAEATKPTTASPATTTRSNRPLTPQRRGSQPLYLDIETIPDFDRQHLFGLDEIPDIDPAEIDLPEPKVALSVTVKDVKQLLADKAAMIAADPSYLDRLEQSESSSDKPRAGVLDEIRATRKRLESAEADRLKKMSTTPEYCKIVAIGWAVGTSPVQSMIVTDKRTEETLLGTFWHMVQQASPIVGYNVVGFDLQVLFARSSILDVPASRLIDMTPWKGDVLDLMLRRFPRGPSMSLKHLATLYGVELPVDDCDGSQVLGLWQQGKEGQRKIGEYVKSDVAITRELHARMAGYWCI